MTPNTATPYDEVLYPNYCYRQTHPDQLGTLAALFGMKPATPDSCRMLELACGDGANLLPLAIDLPNSRFLGIDLASQAVARGNEMIRELQLGNIRLEVADILSLPDRFGEFDYIAAHGLYSWVPPVVQEKILQLVRSCLSPQGVAYISYNTYPGCHMRALIRGMMQYHTREIKDPAQKVAQAKALVGWIASAQKITNGYSHILYDLSEDLKNRNSGAIYHDDLAAVNIPFYFHQFIADAARHGLRFLSEAEYFEVQEHKYPDDVFAQLKSMEADDIIGKEQYLDFLEGRSFRQTLLCHYENKLDRRLSPEKIRPFLLRAQVTSCSPNPDIKTEAIEEFKGPQESMIATSFPLAKAALVHLGEIYPHAVRFDELLRKASEKLGASSAEVEELSLDSEEALALAGLLLRAFGAGVVRLHQHVPHFTTLVSERPVASKLARLQSRRGSIMTSMLYNPVKFEDQLSHTLISMLDGTRDRQMLLKEIQMRLDEAVNSSANDEDTLQAKEKFITDLQQHLEDKLKELASLGFLVA